MRTVNDIYIFVQFELNKHSSGNTLNQDEFNACLAWANIEYFKVNMGLPEEYQVGQPQSKIGYEYTQLITDRMSKFKQWKGGQNLPSMPIDADGRANYPVDYVHYSSIRYNNRPVVPVRDSEIGDALIDSITAPTEKYPICAFYDNFIQFYPITLSFVDFTYLRMPVTPFWAVNIVNDDYVYDANRSIQFEWGDECITDLANLVLKYASINLKANVNLQMAQARQDKGQ